MIKVKAEHGAVDISSEYESASGLINEFAMISASLLFYTVKETEIPYIDVFDALLAGMTCHLAELTGNDIPKELIQLINEEADNE